jgi:hypothetical protein
MMFARDNIWTKNDVFGDRTPIDQSVMRPIEPGDVDEPLDAISGLALGIVGGLLIWAIMLFVLVKLL